MTLQALRDTVIVTPIYQVSSRSIIIPKSALKYLQYDGQVFGEVISVGPEYRQTYGDGQHLKAGDQIIFQRHEGKSFKIGGKLYLKLKSRWIHGVVN
jgi:co-chaperonin GroES (HSP10)